MSQEVKLLALFFSVCSTTLLVSAVDGQQQMNNGRETRLSGHFKSSTDNWCSWTEALSDESSTIISIACQCMGKTGERQAYTCQYISQGELLHDCKASRPKPKDIYNEIGVLLAESGDGCTHEELSLDALNSGGQQICTGATLKRKNHHYPRGPCAGHDEL